MEGKTGGIVAIGAITRESVMGNHAYVIFPSTYTFQQKGKTMRETGSMTFALVKQGAEWKITAWTWSSPEAVPVKLAEAGKVIVWSSPALTVGG